VYQRRIAAIFSAGGAGGGRHPASHPRPLPVPTCVCVWCEALMADARAALLPPAASGAARGPVRGSLRRVAPAPSSQAAAAAVTASAVTVAAKTRSVRFALPDTPASTPLAAADPPAPLVAPSWNPRDREPDVMATYMQLCAAKGIPPMDSCLRQLTVRLHIERARGVGSGYSYTLERLPPAEHVWTADRLNRAGRHVCPRTHTMRERERERQKCPTHACTCVAGGQGSVWAGERWPF
jgi:hypothetical protein